MTRSSPTRCWRWCSPARSCCRSGIAARDRRARPTASILTSSPTPAPDARWSGSSAATPFVFGRGGEEAEELRDAGIAFEIVPGVSSVLGAAARAGIPLTHRLVASDVTLATGHDLLVGAPSASDWSRLARDSGTLVLFMAAKRLRENLDRLMAHGRAPETPAAYIASACTARQQTIVGTLGDLVERTASIDRDEPALIVVGDVVRLRERLAWWEQRPLSGRRILVARARPAPSEIATRLRGLGAEVIEAPQIEVASLRDCTSLDAALARADTFDALVFGCGPGVDATLRRLGELGHDVRRLAGLKLVAIGKQAADRLRAGALQPALVVEGACAEAVGARADGLRGGRLLLVTAEEGRPVLVAELAAIGATVETTAAYRTLRRLPRLGGEGFDAIVVPSSSAAHALFGDTPDDCLLHAPVVVLGPSAETAARGHGVTQVHRSALDTVSSAVETVLGLFARTARTTNQAPTTHASPEVGP